MGMNLSGITLWRADLSRAYLNGTNLSGVDLSGANLSDAIFIKANLSSANLERANLSDAFLFGVNLSGTTLERANLIGADLREAEMDNKTNLIGIILSSATKLGDIRWNGAYLTRVDWSLIPRLGDELFFIERVARPKTRSEHVTVCQDIARAYRGLANALRSQSLNPQASGYRLIEQRWERRAMQAQRKVFPWLGSGLLDLIAGYGERPGRIFVSYLAVILGFTAAYFGVTHTVETGLSHLSWDESLVLSLTSFHGRGFFPGFLSLGDWVSRLAAGEAVIGLFIELVLIATFSRRFLGN